MLEVTNHTSRDLEVEIWRDRLTNNPNAERFYFYRAQTSLRPMGAKHFILSPPTENVPWSVELRCLRQPGKLEAKLRGLEAWFRLRNDDPEWEHVERIQIEK